MVDLEKPRAEQIDPRDIAHHLTLINRFVGATADPYSVAEHSLIGSEIIRGEYALHFLLHDAHEAYLGDVSGPLKALLGSRYGELAALWDLEICKRFQVDQDPFNSMRAWDEVKRIDALMLEVELDAELGIRMRAKQWAVRNPEAAAIYARLGRREGNPELRFLQRLEELQRRARR